MVVSAFWQAEKIRFCIFEFMTSTIPMTLSSIRSTILAIFFPLLLAACGGGGSPANPPAGGITVVPGNDQVTVSWTADAGVEYWLWYVAGSSVTTTTPGHLTKVKVASPYVLTGLTNGLTYAFAVNGRTGGGAGGPLSPSVTAVPRAAGSTWVAGTSMGTNDIRGLTYGAASDASLNFVAVGDVGVMFKSSDGAVWSALTSPSVANFNATLYALSQFIAVGSPSGAGNVFRSTNLLSWTPASTNPGSAQNLNALATNGSRVVAVGDNGTIQSSTDGLTWTTATTVPTADHLYGVTYVASGLWLAVGANGTLLTSTDGLSWVTRASSTTNALRSVAGIAFSNTSGYLYVAVGLSGAVRTSPDGITWTAQALGSAADLYAVNASTIALPASNQFLVVGAGGAAYTSPDAVTWTAQNTGTTANLWSLYGSPALYFAAGSAGANISSR